MLKLNTSIKCCILWWFELSITYQSAFAPETYLLYFSISIVGKHFCLVSFIYFMFNIHHSIIYHFVFGQHSVQIRQNVSKVSKICLLPCEIKKHFRTQTSHYQNWWFRWYRSLIGEAITWDKVSQNAFRVFSKDRSIIDSSFSNICYPIKVVDPALK